MPLRPAFLFQPESEITRNAEPANPIRARQKRVLTGAGATLNSPPLHFSRKDVMAETPHRPHPRPLSPHIQIYRWQVTMAASIVHRATGVALSAGTVLLAWWLIAAASGPDSYAVFQKAASNPLGWIVLFGFVWSLCFHLLNGIRHLAWDLGYGFAVPTANKTGVLVFTLSVLIAIGVFVYAFHRTGIMV
jgi:succinate dehydrogenase / fumarate reductase, cytochrome b subunit